MEKGSPTSRHEAEAKWRTGAARASVLASAALLALLIALLGAASSSASGCTLAWVGDVNGSWYGGTAGIDTNWSDDGFPDAADHVCLQGGGAPYTVTLSAPATVDRYSVESGATLAISGTTLRAEAASSNAGVIELSTQTAALATEDGDAGGAEALINTGALHLPAGGLIHGDLLNQGTVSIARSAAFRQRFEGRAPTLTNAGTLSVGAGATLRFDDSVLEQSAGGTIAGPGAVELLGDTGLLRVGGGTIDPSADVNLAANNSDLTFVGGGGSGDVGVASSTGDHVLTGDVPSGFSIEIGADTALRSASSFGNAGRIRLLAPTATLATEDGSAASAETLTNTGVVDLAAGGVLHGDLANLGTVSVDASTARFRRRFENRRPTLTNAGVLSVADGATLRFESSVLEQASGGEVQGPGGVDLNGDSSLLRVSGGSIAAGADVNLAANDSDLEFGPGGSAAGDIDVAAGTGTHLLSGDVPAGIAIDIEDATTLRAIASFTNHGRIALTAPGAALATENGGDSDAEVLANYGVVAAAGGGAVSGDLVNRGTLMVDAAASFGPGLEGREPLLVNEPGATLSVGASGNLDAGRAAPLLNSGTVRVAGRLTANGFEQTSGSTMLAGASAEIFVGAGRALLLSGGTLGGEGTVGPGVENAGGTVAPGASPGVLTIAGDYAQGPGGTLAVEVQGAGPGVGHDQLRASGNVALGGTLAIASGGFTPAPGATFAVVESSGPGAPAVTGTFGVVDPAGSGYEVAYGSSSVMLVAPIAEPAACRRASGFGVLRGSSRALFNFQARSWRGEQRGHAIHVDLPGRVAFHATAIEDATCAESTATITGRGRSGRSTLDFVITAVDGAASGAPDEYRIQLSNGYSVGGRLLAGFVRVGGEGGPEEED